MAKKILAVDDSKTMREMVVFTLKNAGYEVVEAEDGQAALSAINGNRVDAVITDLNMRLEGESLLQVHPHSYADDRRGLGEEGGGQGRGRDGVDRQAIQSGQIGRSRKEGLPRRRGIGA